MRSKWVGLTLIVLAVPAVATAQTRNRFDVGPVARAERVTVGEKTQVMPVFGFAASARLSKTWGLEAEITQVNGREFSRSRDGISETFAPAGSTAAENERLGVHARWRNTYRPGLGGIVAVTARHGLGSRAAMLVRLGLAARSYRETQEYIVLSIPDGIDPRRLATVSFGNGNRSSNPFVDKTDRGGLLMGAEVPITIVGRLSVAPEVRYVYGGGSHSGDTHREASAGLRARWAF
jgi:hypothetical protein